MKRINSVRLLPNNPMVDFTLQRVLVFIRAVVQYSDAVLAIYVAKILESLAVFILIFPWVYCNMYL